MTYQNVIEKLSQVPSVEDVRVEDDEDKDLYIEYGKKSVDNYIGNESNIINKSKRITYSCKKRNKSKEKMVQSVVHNIRSQVEIFKDMNKK
ncbi:11982_t:CDS:2 [Cetraspora pellucida]|uniref:11982_t:CDS:1 n=1 Tax=Cetraspora pellucida TaxID=1433469 RepID=A0ACA9PAH0_9GLOM|nr:11982_t:CDS:2 [Cetraspora pellucida]